MNKSNENKTNFFDQKLAEKVTKIGRKISNEFIQKNPDLFEKHSIFENIDENFIIRTAI